MQSPVAMMQAPGDASRWFVVGQQGIVRVFPNTSNVDNIESVIEKALPKLPAQLPPIQDTRESKRIQDTHKSTPIQGTHEPTAPGYPAIDGEYALGIDELQWYSFWNPFRSQIAASGFVSQLEKVTGLEYRVVKVKTGVYEVAFAYSDDMERRTKLSQISTATELDLSGS